MANKSFFNYIKNLQTLDKNQFMSFINKIFWFIHFSKELVPYLLFFTYQNNFQIIFPMCNVYLGYKIKYFKSKNLQYKKITMSVRSSVWINYITEGLWSTLQGIYLLVIPLIKTIFRKMECITTLLPPPPSQKRIAWVHFELFFLITFNIFWVLPQRSLLLEAREKSKSSLMIYHMYLSF